MGYSTPILYADDIETVPSDEAEDSQRVLDAMRELLANHERKTGLRERDVHVKSHGCVQGTMDVLPDLPGELAQGLFARPARHQLRMRFSNSSPRTQPDVLPDARGLAIQIQGVQGDWLPRDLPGEPTQDFVMVNHPVFVAKDVKDYLRLQQIRLEARNHPLAALGQALTGGQSDPRNWRWREAASAAQIVTQLPGHPASYRYFSMVPIRYGRFVAKYRVKPATGHETSSGGVLSRLTRPDAMREALAETLSRRTLVFEFQVQLCRNLITMPTEDATVEWSERESPYRTVAFLKVPAQRLDESGDELRFNVWHALVEHRPLGGINRIRRLAYPLSAQWRLSSPANVAIS